MSALGIARAHARAQSARLVGCQQVWGQWGSKEGFGAPAAQRLAHGHAQTPVAPPARDSACRPVGR
eukprot:14633378-Alexandrium_andersonii.AAC.1